MAPPYPGDHDLNKFETKLPTMAFHTSFSFSGQMVFEKKIIKDILYIFLCKTLTLIVASPYPRGQWFGQTWIYTIWGCFHTSFSFLAKWFLRRRFLKNINNISLNPNDLPLKESRAPHFNKLESPSPNDDALWLVWLKLAKWFRRRSQKCKKFTDRQTDGRMDGQTDRRTPEKKWSEKLTRAFSSSELKTLTSSSTWNRCN